jgi:hypothetical protein
MQPGLPHILDLTQENRFLGKIATGPSFELGDELPDPLYARLESFDAELNTELAQRVVRHCCTQHVICNANTTASEAIDVLLIDVTTMRLVEARSTERYFALSYVWGRNDAPDTRKQNINELKHQGLRHVFAHLPAVIEDAITLTELFGERFLWVDKFSIVQDDVEKKHDQIMQMDIIFSQAVLTIVALSGRNIDCPLPGLRLDTRAPIRLVAKGLMWATLDPKSPNEIIKSAVYETRGWTYQERILSRRCLYFTDNQALFQCREGSLPEAMWTSRARRDAARLVATENSRESFDFLNPLSKMWQNTIGGVTQIGEFWRAYCQLVRQHTSRNLSYNSDILNAFAGIIAELRRYNPTAFMQGLPLRFIDVALFWYQIGPLRRREVDHILDDKSQRLDFPSWSWAGWVGPISYALDSAEGSIYPESDIDSFTLNYAEDYQLSGKMQNEAKAPQHRSWAPLTVAIPKEHNSHHVLTFSAKAFGAASFKFDVDRFPSEDELPVSKILDADSKQCGILLDAAKLGSQMQGELSSLPPAYQFIILSHTKRTLSRRGGFTCYLDDGYLEPFGWEYSMLTGPWRCENIMLVRKVGQFYERVAIGMVHEKVLETLQTVRQTICLI